MGRGKWMKINEYHGLDFRVVQSVCLGVGTLTNVYYLSNMSNILKKMWLSCTWLWFLPIS